MNRAARKKLQHAVDALFVNRTSISIRTFFWFTTVDFVEDHKHGVLKIIVAGKFKHSTKKQLTRTFKSLVVVGVRYTIKFNDRPCPMAAMFFYNTKAR